MISVLGGCKTESLSKEKKETEGTLTQEVPLRTTEYHESIWPFNQSSLDSFPIYLRELENIVKSKDYDKSRSIISKIENQSIKYGHHELAVRFLLQKAMVESHFERHELAIELLDCAYDIALTYLKETELLPIEILDQKARIFRYRIRNPVKAKEVLELQSQSLLVRKEITKFHLNNLYNLVTTSRVLGEVTNSIFYAEKLLKILEQQDNSLDYKIILHRALGNTYTDLGNYEKGFEHFEAQMKTLQNHDLYTAQDLCNYSIQCTRMDEDEQYSKYINLARNIVSSKEDSFFYNRTIAFHLMNRDSLQVSKRYLLNTYNYIKYLKDELLYPTTLQWMGEFYDRMGKQDSAEYYYNHALQHLLSEEPKSITYSSIRNIPDVELFLSLIARNLSKRLKSKPTTEFINYCDKILGITDSLWIFRKKYESRSADIINLEYFHELICYNTNLLYNLHQTTGKPEYFDRFLKYLERKIEPYFNNLFTDSNKHIRKIIQNKMESSIIWHWTRLALFQYTISQGVINCNVINLDYKSKKRIRTFINSLRTPIKLNDRVKKSNLIASANWLYKTLIQPHSKTLHRKVNLFTDGLLEYIPFEVLVEQEIDQDFGDLPYLLWKYDFNYPNLRALRTLETPINIDTKILAMAFGIKDEKPHNRLTSLPYSISEINDISEMMDNTTVLTGSELTSEDYLEQLENDYEIIHLATHSESNLSNPSRSYIAFPTENGQIWKLTYDKIDSIAFSCKLIILSSCDTGNGRNFLGYGTSSIQNLFTKKGVQSISTLWKTPDVVASIQLKNLYLKLLENDLAESLSKVKRDWLLNNDNYLSQPYFWSTFQLK